MRRVIIYACGVSKVGCWRTCISAAGLLAISGSVHAKEKDERKDRDAVSEIIVTAQRNISDATHLDAPVKDLPIAIQTVPSQLIEDQGFQRLGDATRNVSGVVRKEAYLGVTDSFGIRGFDARTGLFDGFRHDFYDTTIDLVHVDRIEVIKGPSSVSTGYLEPGGVVSLVTKSATAAPQGEFALTGGNYGKLRAQGDISHPLSSDIGIRLTGAYDRADSFRDYIDSRKWTIGGALTWHVDPATTLDLRAYYLHIKTVPDRGCDPDSLGTTLFTLPRSRFLAEPSDYYTVNSSDFSAVLNHDFGGGWSIRAGVERNRYSDNRAATQTADLQDDGRTVNRDFTLVPSVNTVSNAFAEVHGSFDTFGLKHRVIAGVDANWVEFWYDFRRFDAAPIDIFNPVYSGPTGTPPSIGASREVTTDVGAYVQDLISIGSYWKILAGARIDHYRDRQYDLSFGNAPSYFSQSQATPRIGVIFEPTRELRVYANYARSFNPQVGTRLKNGEIPKPEQGEQYELGVKYVALNGRLTAGAAIYQITKKNVATTDPTDQNFSILTGKERSRGFEFDLSAKPVDGLQLIATYAHTNAIVIADDDLPIGSHLLNVPRNQATLWTRYDPPRFPVGFGLGIFYVGEREAYLPNTFKIPDYTRIDAALYWKIDRKFELAVNLQNLTDITYYDGQNSYIYPGAPRTVLATLRFRY